LRLLSFIGIIEFYRVYGEHFCEF